MYPSSLSDKEWDLIKHHFYPTDKRGSYCKHDRKTIVDAILYVIEGGIKWRMMPNDFPPWQTVYDHFIIFFCKLRTCASHEGWPKLRLSEARLTSSPA